MKLTLNTDGNTKGSNPGIGAIGVVIRNEDGLIVRQGGQVIGQATNNETEYSALISGLYNCHDLGATEVDVFMDSELVVRQMQGRYRVKKEHLMPYHEAAKEEVAKFKRVTFTHIPRAQNALADEIARQAWSKA